MVTHYIHEFGEKAILRTSATLTKNLQTYVNVNGIDRVNVK